jgi:type II secretory pathway pseudopilin PulG
VENMKNKTKKPLYKYGISLIVLVITIIVTLILIAATVISTASAISNAKLTTFSKDLTQIQDAAQSYYITNKVMPILGETTVMTKDDLLAISRDSVIMLEELTENNDLGAQFYKIDLAKINVTKAAYGYGQLGESDIFILAYPSFDVYYPYGITSNGVIYFSITSKISNVTRIPQTQTDTSITSVISSGGIKLTKTNGWANKMGVSLEVDMDVDEVLYMSVSGDVNRTITTIVGKNIFGFNLLSSIVEGTETIKVPALTLVEANYIELGTKPYIDRYVDILKYKNTELLGKVRIDLSNFSKTLPTIINATLSSYASINTVKLLLSNSESGIKEVRYEYLNRYTDNGTIESYYTNITDFDSLYMQSKAKISKIASDFTTTIDAPKNVKSIKVALIDRAGNINLYNQEIAPGLYIGYTLDSGTITSLQVTANMYSINGIKDVSFSKSLDGINFTDEQIYILDTPTSGLTTKQCLPFTNVSAGVVYIKMVVTNYDNTITETRVITVNLTGT